MFAAKFQPRREVRRAEHKSCYASWNLVNIHAHLFTKYPVLLIVLQIITVILLTALTVYFYGVPNFDDVSKGIEARGTPIHDRIIPLERLLLEDDVISPTPNLNTTQNSSWSSFTDTESLLTMDEEVVYTAGAPSIPICGNPAGSSFRTAYAPSCPAGELLTLKSLLSMCQQDDVFIHKSPTFDSVCTRQSDDASACCPSWSLPNYIGALNGRSSCNELTAEDVAFARSLLSECAQHYTSGALSSECGSGAQCPMVPSNCTTYNAIYAILFALAPSDFSTQLAKTGDLTLTTSLQIASLNSSVPSGGRMLYKDVEERHEVDNGITRIEAIGTDRIVKYTVISEPLKKDLIYAGLDAVVVLVLMWLYFGSFFIAIMVLSEILFSLTLAYFLYYFVCGLKFFAFGNMLAVVLVLGVGVDDAFIFHDTFENMKSKDSEKEDKVVLIDTMKLTFPTLFVTSITTASALFVNVASSITNIRLYGVYAGLAILSNFLFTMTWSPATAIIYSRYFRQKDKIPPSNTHAEKKYACTLKRVCIGLRNLFRQCFEKAIPWVAFKLCFVCMVLFSILSAVALLIVFWKPALTMPKSSTEFQIFTLKHPLEKYDQVFRSKFDIERAMLKNLQFIVVWGTLPIDNGNHWDPTKRGYVQLDDTFHFDDPLSQVWLLDFCSEVRQQPFYSPPSCIYEDCFIEAMKIFMETPCNSSTPQTGHFPCCDQTSFPYPVELFKFCAPKYAAYVCESTEGECPAGIPGLRFDSENNIKAFFIQFQSTALSQLELESVRQYYYTALEWVEEKVETAPVGLQGGWFGTYSSTQPFYVDLLINLQRDTPLALGLSLIIALIVLLISNRNILIAIFATLSIGSAIVTSVAIFILIGWELNVFESALIILTVGLATDITIHYGVAYRLAPHDDRESRARYSLRTLASANAMAALSSFIVGALMLQANILIFVQLGIALEIVVATSWAYGTFFFIPLCHVAGPQGTSCLIMCPFCRLNRKDGNATHEVTYAIANGLPSALVNVNYRCQDN